MSMKLNCICCGKVIEQQYRLPTDGVEDGIWDGGAAARLNPGYGSKLDGYSYLIAVCDECIEAKEKEGAAKFIGEYESIEDFGGKPAIRKTRAKGSGSKTFIFR